MPLEKSMIAQIQAVSPDLRVIDPLPMVPDIPQINQQPPALNEKGLDLLLGEAEILFGSMLPRDVISRSPNLKWIQTVAAGVERSLTPEIAASSVIMTNVSGMHVVPISELVFGLILSFAKHLDEVNQNQRQKKWVKYTPTILNGKTLGILGLGNIGRRIAAVGKTFGMKVVATRRHIRQVGRARDVDTLYPGAQMMDLLAESDYVVNCLPHTSETANIISEKELRGMKAGAFLVNIGRGSTIDETTLVRALQEKWIAGAGLDTFQDEPLPAESPLWELPNVIITPHIGGSMDEYTQKAIVIFCDNLRRYLSGKRLKNIVDKKLGY